MTIKRITELQVPGIKDIVRLRLSFWQLSERVQIPDEWSESQGVNFLFRIQIENSAHARKIKAAFFSYFAGSNQTSYVNRPRHFLAPRRTLVRQNPAQQSSLPDARDEKERVRDHEDPRHQSYSF
jgi:hypothetical protein